MQNCLRLNCHPQRRHTQTLYCAAPRRHGGVGRTTHLSKRIRVNGLVR
jgi:hypothetical protein